jgi:hypothetical protein
VGSSQGKVLKGIEDAKNASATVDVKIESLVQDDDKKISLRLSSVSTSTGQNESDSSLFTRGRKTETADVIVVTHLADVSSNHVPRGECAGRTLESVNVVTSITSIGSWKIASGDESAAEFTIAIPDSLAKGKERIVVLIQAANYGPILAAKRL